MWSCNFKSCVLCYYCMVCDMSNFLLNEYEWMNEWTLVSYSVSISEYIFYFCVTCTRFLSFTRWPACWAYARSGSLPLDFCIFNCVHCISILVANKVLSLMSLETKIGYLCKNWPPHFSGFPTSRITGCKRTVLGSLRRMYNSHTHADSFWPVIGLLLSQPAELKWKIK